MSASLEKIDVGDYDVFVQNNEDIIMKLNNIASDTADILANTHTTVGTIDEINSALSTLKTKRGEVSFSSNYESLSFKADAMAAGLGTKSIKVVVGINYAESLLKSYNTGDAEEAAAWKTIYDGLADASVFANVAKIISSCDKISGNDALNFIIVTAGDMFQGSYTNTVETGVDKALGLLGKLNIIKDPAALSSIDFWRNAHLGTAVAFVFETTVDIASDKGEFDKLDAYRLGINAFSRATTTITDLAVSHTVTDLLSYSAVGSFAGPIGTVAGVVVSFPLSLAFKDLQSIIVGDNIIHTFKYKGVEYAIPRNGSGEDYTYDVMLENYRKKVNEWKIGYKAVTEEDYYSALYDDWGRFVERDTSKPVSDFADPEGAEILNAVLQELREAPSYDDDKDYFYYYSQLENSTAYAIYQDLGLNYDFSFESYYNYYHGGDYLS